ncbi:oxidation resistance protein 1 [Polyrhizophydium stewartii]|uniref:Oxidation resistance protein 1 n=1 Tax=Polyrhizophydium stewartii TaxID=2732419 RepID=A0ABR4NFQ6_9FUNG|nr:oxidation resistance protein 1 [Polyrhizophydium stewartii]
MDDTGSTVQLAGWRDTTTARVLDETTAEQLRNFLPPLQRESRRWRLAFSTDQHGMSLRTLFDRARAAASGHGHGHAHHGHTPVLLAIQDSHGAVFGAFLSEPPAHKKGYYGNGSCFLWRKRAHGGINVFLASGRNEFYMLSESGADLAMGGGDGHFGLWIDSDLNHGHSDPCATFDNEALASTPGAFDIFALELWHLEI